MLGLDTPFTHTALPRCVFGSGANRQETTATVASSELLSCRSPPTALVGCYALVVSMDVCDFDSGILDACPSDRVAGLAFSYLPSSQYPGYSSEQRYAYPNPKPDPYPNPNPNPNPNPGPNPSPSPNPNPNTGTPTRATSCSPATSSSSTSTRPPPSPRALRASSCRPTPYS